MIPPASLRRMTTRVGRHLNCREYDLSSRVPQLAALPHVGISFAASASASCLQTWNMTLVFAPGAWPARLIAVVHDHWEW